jgi:WhiB family transcriptional regulator, redox-sensing transcriptional regulator
VTDTRVLPDTDWREQAACLPYPAILFFGVDDAEAPADKQSREDEAKSICALCDVRQECLNYALTTREPYGIWGGLTEVERKALLHGRAS